MAYDLRQDPVGGVGGLGVVVAVAPVTLEVALAVGPQGERQGRPGDDGDDQAEDAEPEGPAVVDPDEQRHGGEAEEAEAVDGAGDGDESVGDAAVFQDHSQDEQGPGDHFQAGCDPVEALWCHVAKAIRHMGVLPSRSEPGHTRGRGLTRVDKVGPCLLPLN